MYCPSCGVAVTTGLSYCNHCGAKLNRDTTIKSPEVKPDLLVTSMVATFIFGLVAITVLMGMMKAVLGLPVERILAFMLVPFVLMLILESVFIRLLFRRNPGTEISRDTAQSKQQGTNELDNAQPRVLPEGAPSVTEHTTRAFEPIYNRENK